MEASPALTAVILKYLANEGPASPWVAYLDMVLAKQPIAEDFDDFKDAFEELLKHRLVEEIEGENDDHSGRPSFDEFQRLRVSKVGARLAGCGATVADVAEVIEDVTDARS